MFYIPVGPACLPSTVWPWKRTYCTPDTSFAWCQNLAICFLSTASFLDSIQVEDFSFGKHSTDRELFLTRAEVIHYYSRHAQVLKICYSSICDFGVTTVPGGRQQVRQQQAGAIHLDRTSDFPAAAFSETCHFSRQVHVKWMKPSVVCFLYIHFAIDSFLLVVGLHMWLPSFLSLPAITCHHYSCVVCITRFQRQTSSTGQSKIGGSVALTS